MMMLRPDRASMRHGCDANYRSAKLRLRGSRCGSDVPERMAIPSLPAAHRGDALAAAASFHSPVSGGAPWAMFAELLAGPWDDRHLPVDGAWLRR